MEREIYQMNYEHNGFHFTGTIEKPSEQCIEEFREYWHKLFDKKTKEIIVRKNDSL